MNVITLLPSSAVCIYVLPPRDLGFVAPAGCVHRSLAALQCPSVEHTPEMPPSDRFDFSLRIVCVLFLCDPLKKQQSIEKRDCCVWVLCVSVTRNSHLDTSVEYGKQAVMFVCESLVHGVLRLSYRNYWKFADPRLLLRGLILRLKLRDVMIHW